MTAQPKSLGLDTLTMGVEAADADLYADMASRGLLGAGAKNCMAVQNNNALRSDTTAVLKDAAA